MIVQYEVKHSTETDFHSDVEWKIKTDDEFSGSDESDDELNDSQ